MKHAQQGVVLLISLVMLLLLTIIAIAAASHANLQLRISSNSQLQNIAFQQAESGLQHWANLYFSSSDPNPEQLGPQAATQPNGRYSADHALLGNGTVYAEGTGISESGLRVYRFEVISTGDACGSANGDCSVTATHRQGFQKRSY
jgi:type II secretory pathway component PulK